MNYSELQAAIASWMDRDDLTTQIPGFITLCESEINRQLRTGDQEDDALTIPGVDDQSSYDLPSTHKGWRTVAVDGVNMDYITPRRLHVPDPQVEPIRRYTLVDGKIKFNAPLSVDNTIELSGYSQVAALTDLAPTNWLLEDHEDVYLYGSLVHAEIYVKNPNRSTQMAQEFINRLGQIIERDKTDRWSGATLAIRSDRVSRRRTYRTENM